MRVGFILLPKFTLMAFAGFVEVLRLAADHGDRSQQIDCQWRVLSWDGCPVRSSCGVEMIPTEKLGSPDDFDYVVVVGGLLDGLQAIDRRVVSYLNTAADRGGNLVGLCTGSFALAQTSLLNGYRCSVHWYHLREFRTRYSEVQAVSDLYVIDRKRITSSGGSGVVDLASHLVERHFGQLRASKALRMLMNNYYRDSRHPQSASLFQESEGFAREPVSNSVVERALQMIEQSIGEPLPVVDLADRIGVERRTLERHFRGTLKRSPAAYSRELRLEHGRWLVTHTDRTIARIAQECGFSDSCHFSRLFRQHFGTSPHEIRALQLSE